jgi:predicted GNAT family N-acyltransferase
VGKAVSSLHCRSIISQETWPLRGLVLRPGRPLASCQWDGDDLSTTHHYGITDAQTVVGIASIYLRAHEAAPGPTSWQLRGMAVHPDRQAQGVGAQLLKFVLHACAANLGGTAMWCNARTRAVPLYERHGFSRVGGEFEIPDVGPHYVMFRPLAARP